MEQGLRLRLGLGLVVGALACGALFGCGGSDEGTPTKHVDVVYQGEGGFELLQLAEAVESAHPYANGLDGSRTQRVHAPTGAAEFRIFFDQLDVERGYDKVEVRAADGEVNQTLTGSFRGWTHAVPGDHADLALISDSSVVRYGFRVTAIQFRMPAAPDGEWTQVELGARAVETAHRYGNNTRRKWTLDGPSGATRIRAKFDHFDTERGYDFVYVYDGHGAQVATYTGARGDFTSVEVAGHQLTLELVTDDSVTAYGFDVHVIEVLGGTDPAGCTSDSDCADGSVCEQVQCVRAPCPALCVPAPSSDSAGLCRDSDGCRSTQICAANLAGPGGVCAAPSWDSHHALPIPLATEHPYLDNADLGLSYTFEDWVERYALSFEGFDVEKDYDFVAFYPDNIGYPDLNAASTVWTGRLGDFETELVDGRTGTLAFTSDGSVTRYGFELSEARTYGVPTELVAVYYEPAQCIEAGRNPRTPAQIRAFLEAHEVSVFGMTRVDVTRDPSCRECACPAGERFTLAVLPDDAARFLDEVPVPNKGLISNDGVTAVGPTVELTFNPHQCATNPWDVWWRDNHPGEDGDEGMMLSGYLSDAFGVELLFSWDVSLHLAACRACSCPRGDVVHIVVSDDDGVAEKLAAAGWAE